MLAVAEFGKPSIKETLLETAKYHLLPLGLRRGSKTNETVRKHFHQMDYGRGYG